MEWYKLRTSKLFVVLLSVAFGVNAFFSTAVPLALKSITPIFERQTAPFSSVVSTPFNVPFLMILVFVSVVSFLYSDFSGGYVKNIAGQVGDRGKLVFAKFIVAAIHNLIFFVAGALSNLLGAAISGQLEFDSAAFGGIITLLLKWLLSLALCAILMFFAVGIRNKTLSGILAVIFSTSVLSLLYLGINVGVMNLLKVEHFDIGGFMPDALMDSVSAVSNTNVINAVVVSAVFIAAFVGLTYTTFKKRDIK